jgi:hypothetical protein
VPNRSTTDPMTITTPEAEVATENATLSIGCGTNQTEVGIIEGRAQVTTNMAGGPRMEITTGEQATVHADGTMRRNQSLAPDRYRWHPEMPLPSRWGVGRLANDPSARPYGKVILPELWYDNFLNRRCWQIRSDNGWVSGSFRIHEDSRFRVRYKVDRPGNGQFLVVLRHDPPISNLGYVLTAKIPFEPTIAGDFRTVEFDTASWIPIRQRPPFPYPWVAFLTIFNTFEDDLGLRVAEFQVIGPDSDFD